MAESVEHAGARNHRIPELAHPGLPVLEYAVFGCLSSLFFYTLLAGYLFATFGYVFAISESLSLKRTDDVVLSDDTAFVGGNVTEEDQDR